MIGNFLTIAETVAGGSDMNYITTGAIAAVCSLISGVALYARGRQKREGSNDFVTRAEFMEFKSEIKADIREMRGTFDKLAIIIDERDKKLSDMIERVAAGAYEGRRRLHEQVNAHGKQLASLETKGDIAKGLGSLGKAIMSRPCNTAKSNPQPQV